jgi:hypothetical protein
VIEAAVAGSDRVAIADRTTADRAQIVTADELERLLCQARRQGISVRTS